MSSSGPSRLGPYELSGEIGRGGMGIVYKGHDPVLQRTVAVKTIHTGTHFDTHFDAHPPQERLLREARSAAGLSHPNVVTVYQAAVDADCVYIAMEYVDGPTLEQWLEEGGASDTAAVIRLLKQVAAGLDYAHRKGIVHRDIKPLNILIDEAGNARITDFGLAKASTSIQLTRTGLQVGTPQYVSPEQAQGKTLDGRSDQFSLAVIAYRALTGHRPFESDDVTSLIFKIVFEEPQSARQWNADLPEKVDAVLKRALAKEPSERYPTCTDFIHALEGSLHTALIVPPPAVERGLPVRKIAIGAGAAIGCLALMAGLSAIFSSGHGGGAAAPTVPPPTASAPPPAARVESPPPTPSPAPEAPKQPPAVAAKTEPRVAKSATKTSTPVHTPAVVKPAPRGMADWEKPDEWYGDSGWMVHKGGNFVLFGPTGQAGTFHFSAIVFKGRRLQWVVNFKDPKNYNQFQFEKRQFTAREVVNGSSKDRAKSTATSDQPFLQLTIAVAPHTLTTSLLEGQSWRVLDTWTAPDQDFTAGKFGFLIPGSDQIGLAHFQFLPD